MKYNYYNLIGIPLCASLGLAAVFVFFRSPQTTTETIDAEAARIASSSSLGAEKSIQPTIGPTYKNQQFHFSLQHPASIQPKEVFEGGTLTALFQMKEGEPGFQVFATPYNESQISEERFLRDQPSGVRREPVDITVAGVRAVKFYSESPIGETIEVWFIEKGILYEVTSYKALEDWLLDILQTWTFEP